MQKRKKRKRKKRKRERRGFQLPKKKRKVTLEFKGDYIRIVDDCTSSKGMYNYFFPATEKNLRFFSMMFEDKHDIMYPGAVSEEYGVFKQLYSSQDAIAICNYNSGNCSHHKDNVLVNKEVTEGQIKNAQARMKEHGNSYGETYWNSEFNIDVCKAGMLNI
jgi:hypothetical protein